MRLCSAALILALAACTTTPPTIDYIASTATHAARPAAASVTAEDATARPPEDATLLGTVRGGFANPVRRLDAGRPLPDLVAAIATQALQARALIGPGAPYRVHIRIDRLGARQLVRREAEARLHLSWVRRSDGRVAFENDGAASIVTGSVTASEASVFGSVDDLRQTVAEALSQALDQALDDPKLARFLAGR